MTTQKDGWTRTAIIAFVAFIGLGLSSGLLGVAWPSMQQQFGLRLDSAGILNIVGTISYAITGFAIGRLVARFSSGTILIAGAGVMALCLLGTALSPFWWVVVLFTFISGFGTGMIDAGLNLYVATYHTAQQMNFLHACFGIGITVGPLLMTFVLVHNLPWQLGYAVVGVILIVIMVAFALTRRLWRSVGIQTDDQQPVVRANFAQTLRLPAVWFSLATYLAYVGMELGIGQWAYTLLTESRHISPEVAGPWVGIYWGAFTGGRIFWSVVANRFKIEKVLRYSMLGTLFGTILFFWNPITAVGFIGLVIAGAAEAPIFPMLMASTAQRVGLEHAENTISLQMGFVGIGGGVVLGLIGIIGATFGPETMALAFVVMSLIAFTCHEAIYIRRKQPEPISVTGSTD